MSNPQSTINRPSPSDQIGVEEIRRQVNAAIIDIETLAISSERPADEKQPTVRELTALVRTKLDADTLDAVQREGLIRFVRRVRRLQRNQPSKIKSKNKKSGQRRG